MRKRILSMALCCVMALSMVAGLMCANNTQTAYALPENVKMEEVEKEANVLKELTLFLGTGKGFELDKDATRIQGIVMLVRLLGEERDALRYTGKHPFTDVPAWGDRYVAYAYSKGYVNGTSPTTYSSDDKITGQQYATLILRALGYNEKNGDFTYAKAIEKAIEIGLIDAEADYTENFIRADIVHMSYRALTTETKSGIYLSNQLTKKIPTRTFKETLEKNNLLQS